MVPTAGAEELQCDDRHHGDPQQRHREAGSPGGSAHYRLPVVHPGGVCGSHVGHGRDEHDHPENCRRGGALSLGKLQIPSPEFSVTTKSSGWHGNFAARFSSGVPADIFFSLPTCLLQTYNILLNVIVWQSEAELA